MVHMRTIQNYEVALLNLKSIVPNFRCGICQDTMDDPHLVAGCVHRFCGKCIAQCGNECATCGWPIHSKQHVMRDANFDAVMKSCFDAISYLETYDTEMKQPVVTNGVIHGENIRNEHNYVGMTEPQKDHGNNDESMQSFEEEVETTEEIIQETYENASVTFQHQNGKRKSSVAFAVGTADSTGTESDTTSTLTAQEGDMIPTILPTHSGPPSKQHRVGYSQGMNDLQHVGESAQGHWPRKEPIEKLKSFEDRLEELKQYMAIHGHCNVPQNYSTLGNWCSRMRRLYKNEKDMNKTSKTYLTPARIKMLEDVNFRWTRNRTFEEWVEELKAYKEEHGNCHVPNAYSNLGTWCNKVRQGYKQMMERGKKKRNGVNMTPERVAILDELGFRWSKNETFSQRLMELERFKEDHGSFNVPRNHPTLGIWVNNLILSYNLIKEGRPQRAGMLLTPERVSKLEAIGFEWRRK